MTSLADKVIRLLIRMQGEKRRMSSRATYAEYLQKSAIRPTAYGPPKGLERKVAIVVRHVDGWPVYEVSPKSAAPTRFGLYLHGGGYVEEIVKQHWTLVAQVARDANMRVTVPIYPLPPRATADAVVPVAARLTRALIDAHGANSVTIMGDSAGGGMALAVAQQLRDQGAPVPARTVLITPWLDVTCTDPQIATIEDRDPWKAPPGLIESGEAYRGDLDPRDPLVSPLFGDLNGLGRILLLGATDDILVVDARNLVARAHGQRLDVEYFEGSSMLHDFPLLPTPEGKRARRLITDFITRAGEAA